MVRSTLRIYTKTGDKGETGLFGGRRVSKASPRVEAYGTVDELNAFIGLARSYSSESDIRDMLVEIQRNLFELGADLATPIEVQSTRPIPRISDVEVSNVEQAIDRLESKLEPVRRFILPSGHPEAAVLHTARAVCRRAERLVVALSIRESVNPKVIIYLNRLSDLLFEMARTVNARKAVSEAEWVPSTEAKQS